MLQFNSDNIHSQQGLSRSNEPIERQKQAELQEQRAKNHWGIEVKESNLSTVMNLMFRHIQDPSNNPSPMQDPSSRR